MIVAELGGRVVVRSSRSVVVRDGVAVHQWNAWVHPGDRGRGIGRTLTRWVEQRAREAATEWPGPEPHELGAWVDSDIAAALALLESEGYRRIRYGFMMLRPLSEPIPDAAPARRPRGSAGRRGRPSPDLGCGLRGVSRSPRRGDAHGGGLRALVHDAESRHEPLAGGVGRRRGRGLRDDVHLARGEREARPQPWLAGAHLGAAAVAQAGRRQGVDRRFTAGASRDGAGRGLLGVDAKNPTGALQLYESLGFRQHKTGIAFRKAI